MWTIDHALDPAPSMVHVLLTLVRALDLDPGPWSKAWTMSWSLGHAKNPAFTFLFHSWRLQCSTRWSLMLALSYKMHLYLSSLLSDHIKNIYWQQFIGIQHTKESFFCQITFINKYYTDQVLFLLHHEAIFCRNGECNFANCVHFELCTYYSYWCSK